MRRWGLILSLVLNALLLGFIIGDLSRPIQAARSLGEMASHYPDEIRRDIRRNIIGDRRALIEDLGAFNDTRARLFEAMRAPEFDRDAVEALMADVREETTALQARLQSATLDALEDAPAEVRARIGTPVLGGRLMGLDD